MIIIWYCIINIVLMQWLREVKWICFLESYGKVERSKRFVWSTLMSKKSKAKEKRLVDGFGWLRYKLQSRIYFNRYYLGGTTGII